MEQQFFNATYWQIGNAKDTKRVLLHFPLYYIRPSDKEWQIIWEVKTRKRKGELFFSLFLCSVSRRSTSVVRNSRAENHRERKSHCFSRSELNLFLGWKWEWSRVKGLMGIISRTEILPRLSEGGNYRFRKGEKHWKIYTRQGLRQAISLKLHLHFRGFK